MSTSSIHTPSKEHFAQIFVTLIRGQVPQEQVKSKAERLYKLIEMGRGCPDPDLKDSERRAASIHEFTVSYLLYCCRPIDERKASELIQTSFLKQLTPTPEGVDKTTQTYIKDVVVKSLKGIPGLEELETESESALWLENYIYHSLSEESLKKQVHLFSVLNHAEYALFTQQRASLTNNLISHLQKGQITIEDTQFFINLLKKSVVRSIQKDAIPRSLIAELQEGLKGEAQSTYMMYLGLLWYGNTPDKREAIRDNLAHALSQLL